MNWLMYSTYLIVVGHLIIPALYFSGPGKDQGAGVSELSYQGGFNSAHIYFRPIQRGLRTDQPQLFHQFYFDRCAQHRLHKKELFHPIFLEDIFGCTGCI